MTTPVIIDGQRATDAIQGIQQEQRVVDMAKIIYLLEPEAAPLVLFTTMISKKAVGNPEYKALEDELVPGTDTVNGTIADNILTLVVDNGAFWQVGSLARVQETGEVIFISAVSGDSLTITRSFGTTAAATITDGDTLTSFGVASEEGAGAPASKTTKKVVQTNLCQIFRWAFQLTNTVMESELYGGKDLPYQQKKGGIEQVTRIERAFLHGEVGEDLSGAEPRRATGGMDEFITSNVIDLGGTFSMDTFYAAVGPAFRYGRKSKMAFLSRGITASISADAHSHLELMPKDKTFGMAINRLVTPLGDLMLKAHDLLEGPVYGTEGFIIDLDNVGYRHMPNRDNKLKTNIQANDQDSRKDEYLAEVGCFRVQERTHAKLFNGVLSA